MFLLALILGIVLSESIAQSCIKKSKSNGCFYYFLLGIISYGIVCGLLYKSYDYRSIGIVNALWSAVSVLSIALIGYYFHHDKFKIHDILGIILIVIGGFLVCGYGHDF